MQGTFTKPTVIARLTVIRAVGVRTIVEIHAGATFQCFYRFFTQEGKRWSTKQEIRTASRNESLPVINSHLYMPGLDVIAKRLESLFAKSNPVTKVTLRIIKRRAYKKLISAPADQLGLVKVNGTIKPPSMGYRFPVLGKAIPMAKFNRMMVKAEVRP